MSDECPYDTPDALCRFCTGEDCGHPDCGHKLGRDGHRCDHDSWDRHPEKAFVDGQLRSLYEQG